MFLRKIDGPRVVTAKDGRIISRADLPNPKTVRWVAKLKAQVVDAVSAGLISRSEALKLYRLTDAELAGWENAISMEGPAGLKASCEQAPISSHSVQSQAGTDASCEAAGLCLDYDQRDASVNGAFMHLTGVEFKILACLARNCGNVVSRAEMMQQLYGEGPRASLRILNVAVCRLRAKLEAVAQADFRHRIETVWGRGYALQPLAS